MTKIAYFDCFSGISGDMTVAAFLDAGLRFELLSDELKKLDLSGYRMRKTEVRRAELIGTKFDCIVNSDSHTRRSLKSIITLIDKSPLGKRVKEISKEIFFSMAQVEAKVHGADLDKGVYFHELGNADSIIDVVGTAIAIDSLGIDEVYSSSIKLGRTIIDTKGGVLPIPSPASLELLKGIPVSISKLETELVTPTGAAILKTLSKGFGEMPQIAVEEVGYGAGSRDLENTPNMLRVIIGIRQESFKEDKIFIVETNIDDMNPQNFEYLFERLFKEGALDVYTTTVQMKKSRPAFKLTVLVTPPLLQKVSSVIFAETTAIGLRFYEAGRFKLARKMVKVNTRYGGVNVKLSKGPRDILTVSPEYDECVRLARKKKVPLKSVYEEAKAASKGLT